MQTLHHSYSFNPCQIAADDTHVCLADWADDKIKRIPVAGGALSVVANGNELILHPLYLPLSFHAHDMPSTNGLALIGAPAR